MPAPEIPADLPREELLTWMLGRLHRRWRMVIVMPLIYLITGMLFRQIYFLPHCGGEGFMNLDERMAMILLFIGGGFVVFAWMLHARLRARGFVRLLDARHNTRRFLLEALRAQMLEFMVCDSVAVPGMVLFLLGGSLVHLFAFVVISSVFYLRALPSGYHLGRAFLHDEIAR